MIAPVAALLVWGAAAGRVRRPDALSPESQVTGPANLRDEANELSAVIAKSTEAINGIKANSNLNDAQKDELTASIKVFAKAVAAAHDRTHKVSLSAKIAAPDRDEEDLDVIPLDEDDMLHDLGKDDPNKKDKKPYKDIADEAEEKKVEAKKQKEMEALEAAAAGPTPGAPAKPKLASLPKLEEAFEHYERSMVQCVDTPGWRNNFTNISKDMKEHYIMAEADLTYDGYDGMLLFDNYHGFTCAAYVYHGLCVNPHWINDKEPDIPCMMQEVMSGKEYNSPELNCCACGKSRLPTESRMCSHEAKFYVWEHHQDLDAMLEESFAGTVQERRDLLDPETGLLKNPPEWLSDIERNAATAAFLLFSVAAAA